jgi:hypothetical protein
MAKRDISAPGWKSDRFFPALAHGSGCVGSMIGCARASSRTCPADRLPHPPGSALPRARSGWPWRAASGFGQRPDLVTVMHPQ